MGKNMKVNKKDQSVPRQNSRGEAALTVLRTLNLNQQNSPEAASFPLDKIEGAWKAEQNKKKDEEKGKRKKQTMRTLQKRNLQLMDRIREKDMRIQELEVANKGIEGKDQEIAELKGILKQKDELILLWEREKDSDENKISDLEGDIRYKNHWILELEQGNNDLQAKNASLKRRMSGKIEKIKLLKKDLRAKDLEIAELEEIQEEDEEELIDLKATVKNLAIELRTLYQENRTTMDSKNRVKLRLKEKRQELIAANAKISGLQSEVDAFKQKIPGDGVKEKKIRELQKQVDDFKLVAGTQSDADSTMINLKSNVEYLTSELQKTDEVLQGSNNTMIFQGQILQLYVQEYQKLKQLNEHLLLQKIQTATEPSRKRGRRRQ